MFTLMLTVIYIAFIGLGVPDSLLGTAWPEIYGELSLPVWSAGAISVIISVMTTVSSLLSAKVISKFGTYAVTCVSTFLTAAAMLGFSYSKSFIWLCLLAIPLGLGAGAIDSGLNAFVAVHFSASHMSFLHCAYGVGVMCGPYLMSYLMQTENGWRGGYRVAVVIQLVITFICFISHTLWKNFSSGGGKAESGEHFDPIPLKELARSPKVRAVWMMFFGSCAVECTCGSWGTTYLVLSRGLPAHKAAFVLALYYSGMTLGRFLSGFANKKFKCKTIIIFGESIVASAIILLILPLPVYVSAFCLFLIGLGNGPVYPNLMSLTTESFGEDTARSVMGSQVASASLGIMIMPPIFGLLGGNFGMNLFPYYILAMFLILGLPTFKLYIKKT